jgi:UDP-N-acetylmuramoyl-tripeptide--D-alanyl-D-alanine ligase
MAEPRGYSLRDAIADLQQVDLFDTCHLNLDGRWRSARDAGPPWPDLAFQDARLDSRTITGGELYVGLPGENTDGRHYVGPALRAGATIALTRSWREGGADPLLSGDPRHDAAVLLSHDPAAALSVLARCWRDRMPARIAAVTGTNGKTTTKDLLAALCGAAAPTHATAGNFNNDLGLPLTLLGLRPDHDLAIVEMGASGAGDIDRLAALASPQVGVITNASEAHLAGFGSLAEIVRTKGELLDHLPADGAAVLNADSPGFAEWRDRASCPVISFGTDGGDHRWSWRAADRGGVLIIDGREIPAPLPGRHNGANLAAALLAAEFMVGRTLDAAAAMSHYSGSPHRSRCLRVKGLILFDDTYNANPASMLTAARATVDLPGTGRVIAVLGAMAELGPRSDALHDETGRDLRAAGVDRLLAVGPTAAALAAGFAAAGGEASVCDGHIDAATELAALANEGDRILFKGSRSAAMERVLDAFLARVDPDLSQLERP